jgi:DNA-directed RNA polymerase specialized sigma24 family protein
VRIGAPDDAVELSATLIHREVPSRRGRNHRTEQEYLELMLDVSECIADVPDRQQRELLERLKWESVAQAARAMQIPRTSLHSWLPKLRQHFEKRSLKDYL